MSYFREHKIRYDHKKARGILGKLKAKFSKKELLEDLYLVNYKKDIYKVARANGIFRLIHLVNEGDNFKEVADIKLEPTVENEIAQFFNQSNVVMRKEREHYDWEQSKIVLDNVIGLGQFIEFYPATEQEKQTLFTELGVSTDDLITESYYSLSLKQ